MYQIPTYLEKLVLRGLAVYKSKQIGIAQQFVLPVPKDKFIVIYGFRFAPFNPDYLTNETARNPQNDIQFVNFLTSNNFFPYLFKPQFEFVQNGANAVNVGAGPEFEKSCYIVANSDVGIYITRGVPLQRVDQNLQFAVLPLNYNSVWDNTLGYGGANVINLVTGLNGTINVPGSLYWFNPLPNFQNTTNLLVGNPTASIYDQLFTIPTIGGSIDVAGYNIATQPNAYKRMHFLQIDYVEINETKPENLQL